MTLSPQEVYLRLSIFYHEIFFASNIKLFFLAFQPFLFFLPLAFFSPIFLPFTALSENV